MKKNFWEQKNGRRKQFSVCGRTTEEEGKKIEAIETKDISQENREWMARLRLDISSLIFFGINFFGQKTTNINHIKMRDLVYAIKIQKIDEESKKKNVEEKKELEIKTQDSKENERPKKKQKTINIKKRNELIYFFLASLALAVPLVGFAVTAAVAVAAFAASSIGAGFTNGMNSRYSGYSNNNC